MQTKRLCAAALLALGLSLGATQALAQSYYTSKQAQESYDAGIKLEREAEHKNQAELLTKAYDAYMKAIEHEPNMLSAYLRLGYLAYALKRSEEGIEILKQGLAQHPNQIELKHYLGLNSYQSGRIDEAQTLLSEVIAERQDLPDAYFVLAKIQLDKGEHQDAQDNFERYASLSPDDATAYQALSQVYIQAKNIQGAEDSLAKLLKLKPEDILATINMGHVKFERGLIDEAVKFYEEAYKLDPRRQDLLYTIASSYYLAGRYAEAIAQFERVLSKSPKHMSAQYFIADAMLKLGKLDEAEKRFHELQKLMPNYRYIQLKLLQIRLLRGDQTALEELNRLSNEIKHPDELHLSAVLYRRAGKSTEALDIHQKLYQSDQKNLQYALHLARELLDTKRYEEASELLSTILDTHLNDDLAWEMMSLTLLYRGHEAMMLGQLDQAQNLFEQVLSMDVHTVQARCNLAHLALLNGNYEEALAHGEAAEALAVDDPTVIQLQALFEVNDAQYSQASQRLRELIKQHGDKILGATGWYLLGVSESNLQRWESAEEAIHKAAQLGVDDAIANAALALHNAIAALKRDDEARFDRELSKAELYKDGLFDSDKIRFDYLMAIKDLRAKRYNQARQGLETVRSEFSKLDAGLKREIFTEGKLELNFELAYVHYESNNLDAALKLLDKPNDPNHKMLEIAIRRKLAAQQMKAQRYDQALHNYERLSSLGSNSSSDQYNLIVAQLLSGKLANANATLERYARQNIPEAVLNYAIFLDSSNQAAKATQHYERYVSMVNDRRAEEVRQMLNTKQRVWGSTPP